MQSRTEDAAEKGTAGRGVHWGSLAERGQHVSSAHGGSGDSVTDEIMVVLEFLDFFRSKEII